MRLLFFLFFSLLYGDDYFISFTYTLKNSQIIHTELNYAKALTRSNHKFVKKIVIPTNTNSVKIFFRDNKDKIIDTLSNRDKVILYSNSIYKNYGISRDVVKITYPPKRYKIYFEGYNAILLR